MRAPLSIATARLQLAKPRPTDASEIFARYASDPDVTRFLGWPRHQSLKDTESFLELSDREWRHFPAGPYLIRSRDDGQLLGSTGFAFDSDHVAATGYVLARDAWGRGYATEALAALVTLAPTIALERVYAYCHPDHRASRRVLEKCAFVLDRDASHEFVFPNLAPGVRQPAVRYELRLPRSPGPR